MPSPLSQSPYLSRNENSSHFSSFPLVAFKPGFALQASELNEFQEQVYYQQTYTSNFLYDIITGNNTNINPQASSITSAPYFVSLNYFLIISPEGIDGSISIYNTAINQAVSLRVSDGIRIWCPAIGGFTINTDNLQIGSTQNFYISFTTQYQLCSSNPNDIGIKFNDNSGAYSINSAGADRFQVLFSGILSTSGDLLVASIERTGSNTYVLTDRLNRKREFTLA